VNERDKQFLGVSPEVAAGTAGYTEQALRMYDQVVLNIIARHLWKCPNEEILAMYNAHISENHLDVGIGTGYFLDKCRFPSAHPKITLSDLNPQCIDYVSKRIRRYTPQSCIANVLEPLPLPPASFDSIGLNYVLHCLPGPMLRKCAALRNLRLLLKEGGVLFGATLLPGDWSPGLITKGAMRFFNFKGYFSNLDDSRAELQAELQASYQRASVRMVGGMALFVAYA
jgi:ubiquinone/menaquinone biosynthesis C-methylase UbiE